MCLSVSVADYCLKWCMQLSRCSSEKPTSTLVMNLTTQWINIGFQTEYTDILRALRVTSSQTFLRLPYFRCSRICACSREKASVPVLAREKTETGIMSHSNKQRFAQYQMGKHPHSCRGALQGMGKAPWRKSVEIDGKDVFDLFL